MAMKSLRCPSFPNRQQKTIRVWFRGFSQRMPILIERPKIEFSRLKRQIQPKPRESIHHIFIITNCTLTAMEISCNRSSIAEGKIEGVKRGSVSTPWILFKFGLQTRRSRPTRHWTREAARGSLCKIRKSTMLAKK